jgi:Fe-coproporphyrin III synthase
MPYSPLKVFHHQEQLDQLRHGEQPVPRQVQLIISDLCNQDCGFCAYRTSGYSSNQLFTEGAKLASFGHNNPVRMIPYEKVLEILDDCVTMGIPAIQLTGGGEPSAHPRFNDILAAVLERGLDLALVTNGVNLNDTSLIHLAKAKWVRVSIDAGTKDTYCKVRNVSGVHWFKVWDNLQQLCQLRDLEHKHDLIVGVGFVVTKDNYWEIVQCARLAKQAGVNNLRISAVFQDEGDAYFQPFYQDAQRLCRAAAESANSRFKVFDLFGDRVEDLHQQSPDYSFCGYQHFTTYIGGDLNVYRCCVLAYNERGKLGSLKGQRFIDLWNSQAKQESMSGFNAHDCPKCMFNEKNRTILYALDPEPRHVNYV